MWRKGASFYSLDSNHLVHQEAESCNSKIHFSRQQDTSFEGSNHKHIHFIKQPFLPGNLTQGCNTHDLDLFCMPLTFQPHTFLSLFETDKGEGTSVPESGW